ncbi:MAG TPA: carboxypeptidase regulatory-like domain-containing protein [Terriglobia bacterium]|nr:carboxypeptidase regulatory-like domain-containing protein [Terriglobia bacterium]
MALLLTILLLLQGLPSQTAKTGTITGTLKDSSGLPVAGVRVVAVPRPDSFDPNNTFAEMSSLIETDNAGHFTLENVPPGKYYVAAGRIDFQTYYPGTQAMAEATMISVEAGGSVSKIDFTLRDSSAGRAQSASDGLAARFTIPVTITVERNVRIPVFGNGRFTSVKLTPVLSASQASSGTTTGAAIMMPLTQSSLAIPNPGSDFEVEMEGLPDGYSVKSIKYGSTLLNGGLLSLATAPAPTSALSRLGVSGAIPQTLTIDLTFAPLKAAGARVSGKLPATDLRGIYLSGRSGTVYIDGSYEFADVPPGRYVLVAPPRRTAEPTLGTVIDVGNRDVISELRETEVPPLNARVLSGPIPSPQPTAESGPVPLAKMKGRVIDSENGEVVNLGKVFLVGDAWSEFNLGPEGTFEFSRLLPGRYDVEVQGVGYVTFRRSFDVGDQDLIVELKTN